MDKPLFGKKVAVLVETEYIHDEIEFYKKRIPELGGELTLLCYLWGKPSRDLVNDIDNPDSPVTSAHRLTVTECVGNHEPEEFDIVICAANYVAVRLREIPPMGSLGSSDKVATAPAVRFFARAMANKNIVKAAMCHALWILTPRPDLLSSRRVICHTVVLSDILNAGATFVAAPSHVVVDQDLVTARSFADIDGYFKAIVETCSKVGGCPTHTEPDEIILDLREDVIQALTTRFAEAGRNLSVGDRPIAKAAGALLSSTLDVAEEVRRVSGVDFDSAAVSKRKPILLVASKFGVWASELTVVAGALMQAGYRVKIASEDGTPPHLLSPSMDPSFMDGAWRCSVVSTEERDLAFRFLQPNRAEHELLLPGNVLDLSRLAKPPQVGDYLKDRRLLEEYSTALATSLSLANDYEAIIVAGGSGAIPGLVADRGLHMLLLAFHRLGKPIMGECNGGLALAQTIDPRTGKSILHGRAVTTHSWLDEYQSGWGWTAPFTRDTDEFWHNGVFDLAAYGTAEAWVSPGTSGNPLIDSEALFSSAVGPGGMFFSPPGTSYSVVVDGNLVTCRTTPDGYPGVLALMALLDGRPALKGRLFIDKDERGQKFPRRLPSFAPSGGTALEAVRRRDIGELGKWLQSGGDPDVTDVEGWTPLLIAAARGYSEIVDLLLWNEFPGAQRADPDLRFPGADALPIYMAGQSGDLETVKSLLKARPQHLFDVATVNGHTVLLQAAFYGQKPHQQLAAWLLEHVGEILSLQLGDAASIAAARRRLLIATNVRGQNATALASAYHIRPMVELLQKYDETTAYEREAYTARLLRRVAPPCPRSVRESRQQELTEELIFIIQSGLDRARENPEGPSEEDQETLGAIENCVKKEPDLQLNRLGSPLQRTPLIIACTGADANPRLKALRGAIVTMLLKYGANPLIREVHAMGINAVIRAAVWGHLDILKQFREILKAERFTKALNERPLVNGYTALHDSVLRGLSAQGPLFEQYLDQIAWLVRHGANSEIEDHTGRTQRKIAADALEDPDFTDNARKILTTLESVL